jgi:hypothetical protein
MRWASATKGEEKVSTARGSLLDEEEGKVEKRGADTIRE